MMFEVKSLVYTLRLARLTNRNDLVPSRTCSFDDIILMQSTGMVDKNSVEVFEGDILYYPEQDEDKYGYIEFDKDRLAFVLDNGFEKFVYGEYGMGYIVGNIYENPELLESVEE
ncbi:YopX family protein [Streptococcus uberis]